MEMEAGCLWKCSVGPEIDAVDAPTCVDSRTEETGASRGVMAEIQPWK